MQHLFYGLFALLLGFLAGPALAQNAPPNIVIPELSIVRPEDAGLRVHTNTQILIDPNAVVPDLFGENLSFPRAPVFTRRRPPSHAFTGWFRKLWAATLGRS